MPTRISVDAALGNVQPYIQFRGVDYALRDGTVLEVAQRAIRFRDEYEAAEREEREERQRAEDAGENFDAESVVRRVQRINSRALQEALVDFPSEVADTVTQREYEALQAAIAKARQLTLPDPEPVDVKEGELKKPGQAASG